MSICANCGAPVDGRQPCGSCNGGATSRFDAGKAPEKIRISIPEFDRAQCENSNYFVRRLKAARSSILKSMPRYVAAILGVGIGGGLLMTSLCNLGNALTAPDSARIGKNIATWFIGSFAVVMTALLGTQSVLIWLFGRFSVGVGSTLHQRKTAELLNSIVPRTEGDVQALWAANEQIGALVKQADQLYGGQAYGLMFDKMELAVKLMKWMNEACAAIAHNVSTYADGTALLAGTKARSLLKPSAYDFTMLKLPDRSQWSEEARRVAMLAETNPQAIMIWEQKRTQGLLVAGFQSVLAGFSTLTGAVNELSQTVSSEFNRLNNTIVLCQAQTAQAIRGVRDAVKSVGDKVESVGAKL